MIIPPGVPSVRILLALDQIDSIGSFGIVGPIVRHRVGPVVLVHGDKMQLDALNVSDNSVQNNKVVNFFLDMSHIGGDDSPSDPPPSPPPPPKHNRSTRAKGPVAEVQGYPSIQKRKRDGDDEGPAAVRQMAGGQVD